MEQSSFSADIGKVLRALYSTGETTDHPVLIMITGLPGSGKSFLAREVAERMPAVIVDSDFVRKILFPHPTYAGPESVWVHRIAHVVVDRLLRTGHSVIYDATNLSEWHRSKVYYLADRAGAKLVIIQTVAPEPVIRERLEKRQKKRSPLDLSDATWQIYEKLARHVDPIRRPHLVIDTTRDLRRSITRILRSAR